MMAMTDETRRPDSSDNSGKKKRGRVENLKPYPPGVSGNPGGQPTGKRIRTWMQEFGQMDPAEWPDTKSKNLPANARIALMRLKCAMKAYGTRDTEIVMGPEEKTLILKTDDPPLTLEEAKAVIDKHQGK
jgi:hypothetical protein